MALLLLTDIVCPFGYMKGVFAQSAHIIIRISMKVTRPRQSIKVVFQRKDGFCFTYLCFGFCGTRKGHTALYQYAKANDSSKLR